MINNRLHSWHLQKNKVRELRLISLEYSYVPQKLQHLGSSESRLDKLLLNCLLMKIAIHLYNLRRRLKEKILSKNCAILAVTLVYFLLLLKEVECFHLVFFIEANYSSLQEHSNL